MAPIGKAKAKKVEHVHANPNESRIVIRNRNQDMKRIKKKLEISLRKLKREQKENKNNEENQESLQLVASEEESEVQEDINQPSSSSTEPSTYQSQEKPATHVNIMKKENVNQAQSNENIESSPTRGHQEKKKKKNRKPRKRTKMSPRNVVESVTPSVLIAEIANQHSECSQLQDSFDNLSLELTRAMAVLDAKLSKSPYIDISKPIESMELHSSASNYIPFKPNKKVAVDSTNQKDILPEKPTKLDTNIKSLDGTEKIKSLYENKRIAIKGNIKVLETSNFDKKGDKTGLYINYNSSGNVILVGDENIQMSIIVDNGSQVICNSKRRSQADLVQNLSCSGEETEINAEPIAEEICGTSNVSKLSTRSCQTVDHQATGNSSTNALVDSENLGKTATNTKCDLNSVGAVSKEDDSSSNNSEIEMLQKDCADFLKDWVSQCDKFVTRYKNRFGENSLKSSDM